MSFTAKRSLLVVDTVGSKTLAARPATSPTKMGQGKKTFKISLSVAGRAEGNGMERQRLAKAEDMALAAAAEAKLAQRLAQEEQPATPGATSAIDVSEPVAHTPSTTSVSPVVPIASGAQSATADATTDAQATAGAAEASMRAAATAAFQRALADGLSKEEARDLARKAGKAAFKATMKSLKAATPGPPAARPARRIRR